MLRKYSIKYLMLFLGLTIGTGCKKFLEVKSDSQLVIPKTAEDLQSLLDNFSKINKSGISSGEVSAGDFYLEQSNFLALAQNLRRIYTWEKDNLFPDNSNDWTNAYDNVYIANVVLDNISAIKESSASNNIKGQALFLRSHAFFQLATTFAMGYDAASSNSEPGIPLRLTSELNEKIFRSSLEQTFNQITTDLKQAAELMDITPVHVFRGSRPAAYALLARMYLYLRDYDNCLKYANLCLDLKSNIISFNPPQIPNINAVFPFSSPLLLYKNPEIIFANNMLTPSILNATNARVDVDLLKSYKDGDNRKIVFFEKRPGINDLYSFNGSYEGNNNMFDGLATDEIYLMRSECLARKGDAMGAMRILNTLLKERWDKNLTYVDLIANNSQEALSVVLQERRKSLLMRGVRWMDLKRLNMEGANITLQRTVNGNTYTLAPHDLRYALAIPEKIISMSGIPQNRR